MLQLTALRTLTAFVLVTGLALAGCSHSGAQSPAVTAVGSKASSKTLTAAQVADALRNAGVPLTVTKAYTAADDPNHLLGRPGGYASKVAFSDARVSAADVDFRAPDALERGGSVEVFPAPGEATARMKGVQAVLQGASGVLGSEYDYVSGPVLVRVSGLLTPDQAQVYQRALAAVAIG